MERSSAKSLVPARLVVIRQGQIAARHHVRIRTFVDHNRERRFSQVDGGNGCGQSAVEKECGGAKRIRTDELREALADVAPLVHDYLASRDRAFPREVRRKRARHMNVTAFVRPEVTT